MIQIQGFQRGNLHILFIPVFQQPHYLASVLASMPLCTRPAATDTCLLRSSIHRITYQQCCNLERHSLHAALDPVLL